MTPTASGARAASKITDTVHSLHMISPDAPNFIPGGFDSCTLRTNLLTFKQYLKCPTRLSRTLDLYYGNIPDAYKFVALLPLGTSDHNTIYLIPAYRPKFKTEPILKKDMTVWSSDSVEQLRGCFHCADWDTFLNSCHSFHDATDVISDYIIFCEYMIIPTTNKQKQ